MAGIDPNTIVYGGKPNTGWATVLNPTDYSGLIQKQTNYMMEKKKQEDSEDKLRRERDKALVNPKITESFFQQQAIRERDPKLKAVQKKYTELMAKQDGKLTDSQSNEMKSDFNDIEAETKTINMWGDTHKLFEIKSSEPKYMSAENIKKLADIKAMNITPEFKQWADENKVDLSNVKDMSWDEWMTKASPYYYDLKEKEKDFNLVDRLNLINKNIPLDKDQTVTVGGNVIYTKETKTKTAEKIKNAILEDYNTSDKMRDKLDREKASIGNKDENMQDFILRVHAIPRVEDMVKEAAKSRSESTREKEVQKTKTAEGTTSTIKNEGKVLGDFGIGNKGVFGKIIADTPVGTAKTIYKWDISTPKPVTIFDENGNPIRTISLNGKYDDGKFYVSGTKSELVTTTVNEGTSYEKTTTSEKTGEDFDVPMTDVNKAILAKNHNMTVKQFEELLKKGKQVIDNSNKNSNNSNGKTVVKKGYNATTNQTQFIYSDGTKETVNGKQ